MYLAFLLFSLAIYPLTFLFPSDPQRIMWKITFYHGIFGIFLIAFSFVSKRGVIGLIRSKGVAIPDFIWPKIDIYYSIIFILLAVINAWFVLFMSVDQWVDFKLFVPFPVLVFYSVIVFMLVSKNIIEHEQKNA